MILVKSQVPTVKLQREEAAQRVLAHFEGRLSDLRLLCFFDDEDCQEFKFIMGKDNRGFYRPLSDSTTYSGWPEEMIDRIFVEDAESVLRKRVIDHVVYLHGDTCKDLIGLTMTFAHELQHVAQRRRLGEIFFANGIVKMLPLHVIDGLALKWKDIPIEREARAVAKKMAIDLFGPEAVSLFMQQRIAASSNQSDIEDCLFIQTLDTSLPYDVEGETVKLFRRLGPYRQDVEKTMAKHRSGPEFDDFNLDSLMA